MNLLPGFSIFLNPCSLLTEGGGQGAKGAEQRERSSGRLRVMAQGTGRRAGIAEEDLALCDEACFSRGLGIAMTVVFKIVL